MFLLFLLDSRHYRVVWSVASLDACKQLCVADGACVGIEYNPGGENERGSKLCIIAGWKRCEIWVRPEGIEVTKTASGYICLKYLRNAPEPSTFGRDLRFQGRLDHNHHHNNDDHHHNKDNHNHNYDNHNYDHHNRQR